MDDRIIINEDASVAYLENGGFMFHTGASASSNGSPAKPTSPQIDKSGSGSFGNIAPWGEDNLFPQNVLADIKASTIISATVDWKARALCGEGIITGEVKYEGDKEIFSPKFFDEFEEFKTKSNIDRYLIEAANDFYWFYNVFPELILSKDRSQIVSIAAQDAAYCRWGLQNDKTGLIDKCYINANWDKGARENDPHTTVVPVIDPYYDPVTTLKESSGSYKYIYPVSYPTPGKTYYQLAHWNSIRESGWLDIAKSIPLFKKSMLKNQMTIKYIIRVADYWWSWKYPEWDKLSAEKRKSLIEEELKKFTEFLKGEERAGLSMLTTYKFDSHTMKEYRGWDIEAVDNKIKDGIYIEDSQEASSHMLYALGVDQTIIATAPGKGVGAGSGSDKREAFNMYISLVGAHERLLLEPLYFIRNYNGWDKKMRFRFKRQTLQTKDQMTPAKREVSNGTV